MRSYSIRLTHPSWSRRLIPPVERHLLSGFAAIAGFANPTQPRPLATAANDAGVSKPGSARRFFEREKCAAERCARLCIFFPIELARYARASGKAHDLVWKAALHSSDTPLRPCAPAGIGRRPGHGRVAILIRRDARQAPQERSAGPLRA